MLIKCAIFQDADEQDKPSYKELDAYLGKGSKVLYGGGKRNNKKIPHFDELHLITNAFSTFEKILFTNNNKKMSFTELFVFENDANATALILKYPNNVVTHFIVDAMLINELHHLSWSHYHLTSYTNTLKSNINSLSFFEKNEIGDNKLYKKFPAYNKSINAFIKDVDANADRVADMAGLILKSGW
ncbi:hypothetical protein G6700_03330 [Polynucleobacter paneuropaeus]|nr:hypothetical protein G6700_03330 [Polynucleobacter paneuropaeus]